MEAALDWKRPVKSALALRQSQLPGLEPKRGKVRDIYDLGDQLLLVATDRISAFDCVLPDPIPHKGQVLTALSAFWFERFASRCPHHLIEVLHDRMPVGLEAWADQLRGRSMICKKARVVPIECVARGFLAGSGWQEYQATRTVCGIALPDGLRQCDALPEPIFTPATKADTGHDENISFETACRLVGSDVMRTLREKTMRLYDEAAAHARQRGILLADTKFEFGLINNDIILIDEAVTPDSSRFWPADRYESGRDQESFDKQFVRNYLQGLCDAGRWDKTDPAPGLPQEVIAATSQRYIEAYERITQKTFPA